MKNEFKEINLNDLQVGDILVFPAPEDSALSQAIALLTDSSVSHGALLSEVGERYIVAETATKGLAYNPLPKDESPYVLRYKLSDAQREELLHVVQAYISEGNDYGYADLIMLGLLLLFKKFSKKTLTNKILYQLLIVISIPLQKVIQKYLTESKHPMVCSQFVAQCYTDADCDLQFSQMVIAYGPLNKAIAEINSLAEKAATWQTETPEAGEEMPHLADSDMDENEIMKQFVGLLREEKHLLTLPNQTHDEEQAQTTIFSEPSLVAPGQKLAQILAPVLSELSKSSTDDSHKMSTLRNCFVTPVDLLSNCTNTVKVGQLIITEK